MMQTQPLNVCTHAPLLLERIIVREATIGLLHSGCKILNQREKWQTGELFCFARNSQWHIEQRPQHGKPYRATLLILAAEDLQQFHHQYPHLATPITLAWHTPADTVIRELWQRIETAHSRRLPAWQRQHRLFELLLYLRDLGWTFATPEQLPIDEHIRHIIANRPDYPWTPADIAQLFHISISTCSAACAIAI